MEVKFDNLGRADRQTQVGIELCSLTAMDAWTDLLPGQLRESAMHRHF